MLKLNRDPDNLTIHELVDQGYVARVVARRYNPDEHGKAWDWINKNGYVQSYPPDHDYVAEQVCVKHWNDSKTIKDLLRIAMQESGGKLDPNKMFLAIMNFIDAESKRKSSERKTKAPYLKPL